MGLYVRKDDQRSELQERIAAELQEKAKKNTDIEPTTIDGVDDSGYMDNTKSSSGLLGVWLALLVVGIGVILWLIVRS